MKAITLHEPHASLIIHGFKRYETRTWKPYAALVGKRIAIHASKSKKELKNLIRYKDPRQCTGLIKTPFTEAMDFFTGVPWPDLYDWPLGCVLGTAVIYRVWKADGLINPGPYGDFSSDRYAWELTDVIKFPKPIKAVGRQGLWNWDEFMGG